MFGKPAANRGSNRPGVGGRKKGTGWSESERITQLEVRSRPGYYDFTQNTERNKKISQATKGRKGSAAGKKWFNNGQVETYAFECPDSFVPGRLAGRNSNKKGLLWYNNGLVNKQFKDGQHLEGFVRGRINKK